MNLKLAVKNPFNPSISTSVHLSLQQENFVRKCLLSSSGESHITIQNILSVF